MGNYAAVSDIVSRLQAWPGLATFDGTTTPTDTEVGEFINQVEGEVDGVLSAEGYPTVPATAASDVNLLKRYVADEVAAMVWGVKYQDAEASTPFAVKRWHEMYTAFLNRLRRGEQHLPSQQPQSEDEPGFLIVRHPERDDTFTYQYDEADWDE